MNLHQLDENILKTLEIIKALKIKEKTMITIEMITFPMDIPRKS